MLIRTFTPADLDATIALVSETFERLFEPSMYMAIHEAWPGGQLVMVDQGRLVGLLLSMKRSNTSGRILVMTVRQELRDQGLGATLLRRFMAQCIEEGLSTVYLEVRLSNEMAQAFYQRFGFRVVRVLPRYYPDGEEGVLMARFET